MQTALQSGRQLWKAGGPVAASRHQRHVAYSAGGATPSAASTAAAGPAARRLARGDVVELQCTDLAFGGEGVCRTPDDIDSNNGATGGGCVVFVPRALPGERLSGRVVDAKRSWARGVKLQTLAVHDAATEPACQHFNENCGGCSLQSLQYGAQLAAKQRQVADLLQRTAGLRPADVADVLRPPLGCPNGQQYGYRNRMEFSFEQWPSGQALQPTTMPEQQQRQQGGERGRGRGRGRGGAASGGGPSQPQRSGGNSGGDGFALGLHLPGSSTAVLPITHCHLQSEAANLLLREVRRLCVAHGLSAYDPRARTGLLQHVVIRRGSSTNSSNSSSGSSSGGSDDARSSNAGSSLDGGRNSSSSGGGTVDSYLVNFVTASPCHLPLAPVAAALMQLRLPPSDGGDRGRGEPHEDVAGMDAAAPAAAVVAGVVNSVSQRGRPLGERRLESERVLAGRGHLTERLCGLEFEVSANSFFQTNTRQAEVLYRLVAQAAELRPSDVVLDLFCGTGTIGLTLARACRSVRGVELSAAAVADARRNAARNGILNAEFVEGDLESLQQQPLLLGGSDSTSSGSRSSTSSSPLPPPPPPDVVVVDPARPGLAPALIARLRSCGCRRLVYVSCNAATQARDIKLLCAAPSQDAGSSGGGGGTDRAYRLVSVQAVDLYPHTAHVETVAVLDVVGAAAWREPCQEL